MDEICLYSESIVKVDEKGIEETLDICLKAPKTEGKDEEKETLEGDLLLVCPVKEEKKCENESEEEKLQAVEAVFLGCVKEEEQQEVQRKERDEEQDPLFLAGVREKNLKIERKDKMSWAPSIVLDLIQCVKMHPCLYNSCDTNYRNKYERQKILADIADKICEKRPGTTPDDVKRKWNIIRSTYVSEKKKIEESRKSGVGANDVFKPCLYYFSEVDFIDSSVKPRTSTSTFDSHSACNLTYSGASESGWETINPEIVVGSEAGPQIVDPVPVIQPEPTPETPCLPSKKRKRGGEDPDISGSLSAVTTLLQNIAQKTNEEDPLMVYSKHLYHSLKELPEDLRAEVQNKFDNLLFDAKRRRGFPTNK